ncbi:MAG: hypothetical protein ABJA71_13900 [Ginsengibacter sp.]
MLKRVIIIILISACSSNNLKKVAIPGERKEINKKPVASYLVTISDPRLDQKFGIEIYETPATFKYLLVMQYEGIEETDTLKVPNLDTWPIVQVKPGSDSLSCVIGFLNEKKEFMEYKLLSAKNDQLKLTVLRRYEVDK